MTFENLFVRKQKSLGGIQLDAVLTESHTNTIRLTKNPVELGADITDHAVIEPKTITLDVIVTDNPIGLAALGQIVDNVTGLFGTSNEENVTRSNAAYNSMVSLMETREPLEVQTKLRLYENMIITGLSSSQDKDSSRIARMVINLEEVIITESEIVQLEPTQLEEGSPKEQGSSPDKRGRQEPVEPSATTNKSVLKSVVDFIGG